ncbi:MAG: methylated-DNA--[protein]-cysteine S-methyltransferase [Verrucomicrobia bacterium]|nr:methylated-DNA--[protein]-cysteine S-methyltransferase [Verrucomicrobiota bacterium]
MKFKSHWIPTPLGPMLAIADEKALYVLEFEHRKRSHNTPSGRTSPIDQIAQELELYFAGKVQEFRTPIAPQGTAFQKQVWEQLQKIPYGETISYSDLAIAVDNPLGCRAVAQANGANQLAIIIPCHRVINKSGAIGGYGGGLDKKQWLLNLESKE